MDGKNQLVAGFEIDYRINQLNIGIHFWVIQTVLKIRRIPGKSLFLPASEEVRRQPGSLPVAGEGMAQPAQAFHRRPAWPSDCQAG